MVSKSDFLEIASFGHPEKFKQWLRDYSVTSLTLEPYAIQGFRYNNVCPVSFIWMLSGTPVTSLDLSAFGIVDHDVVKEIVEALPSTNITRLDLSGNSIGDEGAKAIAEVLPLTKITWLDVSNNKMSKPLEGEVERLVQRNQDKKDERDNAYLFSTLRYRMARLNEVILKPEVANKKIRNAIHRVFLWGAGNQLTVKKRNEVLGAGRIMSELPKDITAHVLSFLFGGKGQFALTLVLDIYDRYHPERLADVRLAESMKNLDLNTREEKEECSNDSRACNDKYPNVLFSHAIEIPGEKSQETRDQKTQHKNFRAFFCC